MSFSMHIFSFRYITEDRCGIVNNVLPWLESTEGRTCKNRRKREVGNVAHMATKIGEGTADDRAGHT